MNIYNIQTDEAVLQEIGARLTGLRLGKNWTQEGLANQAGVGKSTVERIEKGVSSQTINFVKIFRALDLLPSLFNTLPESTPSPLNLLKLKGKTRIRASKKRKASKATTFLAETKPWVWGEDK